MGKLSIWTRIKLAIGSIGWKLFIWGNSTTEEEYWHEIYLQEKPYEDGDEMNQKSSTLLEKVKELRDEYALKLHYTTQQIGSNPPSGFPLIGAKLVIEEVIEQLNAIIEA